MIFGQKASFDLSRGYQNEKTAKHIILPPVKKDVSLDALLEEPLEKKVRRNPLEWLGASFVHILILAVLIIVPLYTTGTIKLGNYNEIPLYAPPPLPPPPAAVAAAAPAAPHVAHPHALVTFHPHKLIAPISVPKKMPQDVIGDAAPSLGGVADGVPGGVPGGQIGGIANGIEGAAGNAPPPPPPARAAKPVAKKKIVRAGGEVKAPRQIFNVNPDYPPIARQVHMSGVVTVDAIIDEQGNVVEAHAVSGHPLLIPAALKAVLQWKYEPSRLNGEPISVELVVQVQFRLPN